MADEAVVVDPNAAAGAEAGAGVETTAVVDPGASALGAGDLPTDTGAPAAPVDWPQDWKDKLAGEDPKLKGFVSRYGSPAAIAKAAFEANNKIRSGQYRRALGDDASPEEIAAYRKEAGIPDDAAGYDLGVTIADDAPTAEADKAILDHFKTAFHSLNVPPATAKGIVKEFYAYQNDLMEVRRHAAIERTAEARAAMRQEMGQDYGRNLMVAKQWLTDHLGGDDARNAMADLELSDGTRLGDHPAFVKMVVQAALANADDGQLATAEFGGGQSVAEQYNEALNLKYTDPNKYHSPEHQAKLERLAVAKIRSEQRSAA